MNTQKSGLLIYFNRGAAYYLDGDDLEKRKIEDTPKEPKNVVNLRPGYSFNVEKKGVT